MWQMVESNRLNALVWYNPDDDDRRWPDPAWRRVFSNSMNQWVWYAPESQIRSVVCPLEVATLASTSAGKPSLGVDCEISPASCKKARLETAANLGSPLPPSNNNTTDQQEANATYETISVQMCAAHAAGLAQMCTEEVVTAQVGAANGVDKVAAEQLPVGLGADTDESAQCFPGMLPSSAASSGSSASSSTSSDSDPVGHSEGPGGS